MKIENIAVYVLSAPRHEDYWGVNYVMEESDNSIFHDYSTAFPLKMRSKPIYTKQLNTVLVKVVSADGCIGWGESKGVVAPKAVKAILEDMVIPAIRNMDPLDIAVILERLRGLMRLRGHLQGFYQEAISGLEIALFDLKGKATGLPVYQLLGGAYRKRIPVYASGIAGLSANASAEDEESLNNDALAVVKDGFRALKIAVGNGATPDLRSVDIVREAVGDEISILVDVGGCYDFHTALAMCTKLKQRRVFWFEAPLPLEDLSGYIELSKFSEIPISNDLVWNLALIRDMFSRGGKLIFLPEVLKAGGISACKEIADLANHHHLPFAPHLSQGSIIQFAATAHLCAACVNFLICEYWWQKNPLGNAIVNDPLQFKDGFLHVPEKPGIGVEIDEQAIQPYILP